MKVLKFFTISVRSCLLIPLIKCLKGHKSLGSLCNVWLLVVTEGPTKGGTRCPIELFWTAKNNKTNLNNQLTCATGDDNKEESFSSQVTPGGILACLPHSVKWKGWWKLHFYTQRVIIDVKKVLICARVEILKVKIHLLGWIKFSVCCIHVNFGMWPQQPWMSLLIMSTLTFA